MYDVSNERNICISRIRTSVQNKWQVSSSDSTVCLYEGDLIHVWCQVRFHGNLAPIMEWKQDGKHVTDGIFDTMKTHESVISIMSKEIYFSDIKNITTVFSCKTFFNNTVVSNNSARTTTEYEYTWKILMILIEESQGNYQHPIVVILKLLFVSCICACYYGKCAGNHVFLD